MNRGTLVQLLSPEGALVPPIASLEYLGRQGWDVHLLCERVDPDRLEGVSALPHHVALRQLHPTTGALRAVRRSETALLFRRVARALARHPVGVTRGLGLYGFPTQVWIWDRYFDALLVALRPRLVHLHVSAAFARRRSLLRLLGSSVVLTVGEGDLPPIGREAGTSWREVLALADGFCFPDEAVREWAIQRGLPSDRPWTVGASVSDGISNPGSAGRLRLLSIGDLSWRQGYEHALHAVRLLLDRGVDCEYRLVGDGKHAGALRFACVQLGLDGRAELIDPQARGPSLGHLRWADVYLHPAVADEPLHHLDAAAELGMPIVTTASVRAGEQSDRLLTIPRRDPRAIADAVAQAAQRFPTTRRSHKPAPSLEECLQGLEALYHTILGESVPGR